MTARRRGLCAALALLAHAGPAGAQGVGRFRFAWARDDGADRCPDGPSIAREVARRLGRDPFVSADAPSIEASVQRTGGRWIARLVVRDADDSRLGAREFTSEAADCGPVAAAIALGVALSIDPVAALRAPRPPEPTPAPPTPAPAVAAPTAPPRVVRAPETPWPRRAGVSARAVAAFGLLPGAAVGASIAAEGPIGGRWRWSAGFMYLPESGLERPAGGYAFGLVAAWAGPCFDAWRTAGASLTGCAGVDVGALRAVVRRGDPSTVGERPWVAGFVGGRLRGRVWGPLALELGGELTVPFVRDRFLEPGDPRPTAFQQPPVAGVVFGGAGLQFP
jgi:hypothetical protein